MAIKFESIGKFEETATRGLYEFTPEMREQVAKKAVCERRFARWCDAHNIGESYEDGVKALYAFYEDLEQKGDKDRIDQEMLKDWEALHNSFDEVDDESLE